MSDARTQQQWLEAQMRVDIPRYAPFNSKLLVWLVAPGATLFVLSLLGMALS